MIDRLRRRFIIISTISVFAVIAIVFGVILALNISSMNRNMDFLADSISDGGGIFPTPFDDMARPDMFPPKEEPRFDFVTPETPFSTRHFTVFYDHDGRVVRTNTEFIYSISEKLAVEYANKALDGKHQRGWMSNYRYKIFDTDHGRGVVFVDGSMNRSAVVQSMTISGVVLLFCAAMVLLLILLMSKRAVKPIADSYEKQRRFVTDANHELKTPLTLILANLDIAEAELGQNEWLDDIRTEGQRMSELMNQLVALSRMDEAESRLSLSELELGELVYGIASEFEPLAISRGKRLEISVERDISCVGDEALLRRLVGILLDNAVKYCDPDGEIKLSLHRGHHTILTVENSYKNVDELEFGRLFDRFYRADDSRKFTGGFGVGLSMAKSIVETHRGSILVYKKDPGYIGFKVTLK